MNNQLMLIIIFYHLKNKFTKKLTINSHYLFLHKGDYHVQRAHFTRPLFKRSAQRARPCFNLSSQWNKTSRADWFFRSICYFTELNTWKNDAYASPSITFKYTKSYTCFNEYEELVLIIINICWLLESCLNRL